MDSRIPTRGLTSKIPMPGQIKLQTQTFTTKLTRPTDGAMGGKTKTQGKPYTGASSKLFRFIPRLEEKAKDQKEKQTFIRPSLKKNLLKKQSNDARNSEDNDLMLIDETIDLVGSDENVNRHNTVVLKRDAKDATFDIVRKDGTFIKSPSGSMNNINNLNNLKDVSKSRDSLIHLTQGLSRLSSIRSPKNWGSDELLNLSRDSTRKTLDNTQVFSSTMLNNQLLDVTPAKPFMLNLTAQDGTPVPSTTMLLCMSQQNGDASNTLVGSQMETSATLIMDVDDSAEDLEIVEENSEREVQPMISNRQRYSFGLDLTECTLDCSLELCDTSIASNMHHEKFSPMSNLSSNLNVQESFEMDESLGILTPERMKEFLDSTTNIAPHNLDLPLHSGKMAHQECRVDQTPSPEELPLDPVVEVNSVVESKTENSSRHPASFITSITSITSSLDTGYIGDAEMSRPGSRAAVNNVQQGNWEAQAHLRTDPMTDSDFFTESDADDFRHADQREQRRAQVMIDGVMYGPLQPGTNPNLFNQPEDSCMESSGIFSTDETASKHFEEKINQKVGNQSTANDVSSPDDTISSSNTAYSQNKLQNTQQNDYSQQKSSSSPSESPCVYEAQSVAPTKTPSRINAVKKSPNGNRGAIRKIMKNESKWSENLRASANKVASDVIEEIHENKQKKNGKWDAVMNKIAENKRSKKSFHEVRSKVTCGQQDWPSSKRDSSSSASTSKRGRTVSKESSQSDFSNYSPNKMTPKSFAKKRDVRTINSSPCDLGPPAKTTTRPAVLQKRAQLSVNNSPSQIQELQKSPSPNKVQARRFPPVVVVKTQINIKSPLKDQNRLSGPAASSPKASTLRPHSSIANSPSSNRNAAVILEKSTKPLRLTRCTENDNNNSKKLVNKNTNSSQKAQLAQQSTLRTQMIESNLMHANKSAAALGVLVQYLAFNLEAFSCPSLKKAHQKATKELLDIKQSCQTLEEKLADKEEHFSKRESELQDEISKVEICLSDAEREARHTIETLETELLLKSQLTEEQRRILRDTERRSRQQEADLQAMKEREKELLARIEALACTENELREKVHTSEMDFSERLHFKDKELAEKVSQLTKQMDDARIQSNCDKRELEEKLNLSRDELAITRSISRTHDANASSKNINLNRTQILEEEVESLRCVLELKQSEISELRKNNQEHLETIEQLESQNTRYSAAESRLQMQLQETTMKLQAKQDEEKELLLKIRKLEDVQKNEAKKGNRLSLHNEELQWRLKQNSEKYSMAISELSKSYHEQSSYLCNKSNASFQECLDSTKSNGSIEDSIDGFEESHEGPTSPIIKGIVEKSDSISWMLEMDHETPEALATRMVRRAGSFRSEKCSPSPVPKRQKCQNNTSIQQSASATLISRQHSEPSPQKLTPSGRSRSKSVSNQKTPEQLMTNSLQVPLCASSPQVLNLDRELNEESLVKEDFFLEESDVPFSRSRASTFNSHSQFEFETAVHAAQYMKSRENRGRGLITCDTAALKRSEMKKLRRPKIGAGEAMISGSNSNSESEVSSGASSASSTAPSSPSLCSEQQKIASETFMLKCKSWNDGPNESHV